MNEGNLVQYGPDDKTYYVVTRKKKFYFPLKDRVLVINPISGGKYWFLEKDLEVLNGNDNEKKTK